VVSIIYNFEEMPKGQKNKNAKALNLTPRKEANPMMILR